MKSACHIMTRCFMLLCFLGVVLSLSAPSGLALENEQTIAVLPLSIHSDKDLTYLKKGISRMFYSRLSSPGKVTVVPPEQMTTLVANDSDKLSDSEQVAQAAKKTGSQFVLQGSITELAGAFSIDAKVYDIANERYMAFFEQSPKADDLVVKVDRMAAAINKKVFDRETVTWAAMEKEKQDKMDEYKRKNPEYMMNLPQGWQDNKKEKIGWKIWKYIF